MAGSSPRVDEGKKKARIEIIPLIDVIFFLLATFVTLFTLFPPDTIKVPARPAAAFQLAGDLEARPGPGHPADVRGRFLLLEPGAHCR